MTVVNMFEAKSSLSRLVDEVESGREPEIIIARHGRPAARLVPIASQPPVERRIGVAKGQFVLPESIDEYNDEIAEMFYGKPE
ncbi:MULTISPECIES: type II toxin-antitoxin system Phd/YefM family antitoxin [unclassified Achromobacter]|uniref:type II toxin-antitoxin system Phd/YefM family antitoxin n=1 Tax=unclassified Achromobacter TaxID=2626865 RepID=UPI000B5182BD|nr:MULTISPECIES: type II toxin-antitoxin system prevent-host-death family antitoxin [unclassified Achromobacter]OWT79927.1 prevent-host-death protein [Achromobacter sp. HZ34]OWT81811.1 prevent-host-death protein [Achromobacter sp. HZ28]